MEQHEEPLVLKQLILVGKDLKARRGESRMYELGNIRIIRKYGELTIQQLDITGEYWNTIYGILVDENKRHYL